MDETEESGRQAQKLEALGQLAAGLAHDFNNLLTPIVGYTQLALQEVGAGSPASQRLHEVLLAASRAQALVRTILGFGRGSPAERSVVRVSAVADEALRMVRASIPPRVRVELRGFDDHDSADLDDRVLANPGQLGQVLVNLYTNALHAMESSGGVLGIAIGTATSDARTTEPDPRSRSFVEIVVSDTGVGIAPQLVDTIFEPFFTTKRRGEGSGMGLAIARGIVVEHGGTISVESEPGRGSRFHVYLPGRATDADAALAMTPESSATPAALPYGGYPDGW